MLWILAVLVGCVGDGVPPTWESLDAGAATVCGIRADSGELDCWGGTGSNPPAGLTDLAHYAIGYGTGCAVDGDGAVTCWGGEESPGELEPAPGTYQLVAPHRSGSCGLRVDGEIACWGATEDGRPAGPFVDLVTAAAIGVALDADGAVHQWGGFAVDAPDAVFVQLDTGYREVCGLTDEGAVHCWADPEADDGDAAPTLDTPEGTGFTLVAAGYGHGCALDAAGEAVCWGEGPGTEAEPGPFTDLAAGSDFTCGLREADQQAVCWGYQSDPEG